MHELIYSEKCKLQVEIQPNGSVLLGIINPADGGQYTNILVHREVRNRLASVISGGNFWDPAPRTLSTHDKPIKPSWPEGAIDLMAKVPQPAGSYHYLADENGITPNWEAERMQWFGTEAFTNEHHKLTHNLTCARGAGKTTQTLEKLHAVIADKDEELAKRAEDNDVMANEIERLREQIKQLRDAAARRLADDAALSNSWDDGEGEDAPDCDEDGCDCATAPDEDAADAKLDAEGPVPPDDESPWAMPRRTDPHDKLRLIADTVAGQAPFGTELADFQRRLRLILAME